MSEEEKILNKLLDLAEKGEIKYTPRQLKKFTEEKLEQIYKEYQARELDETNELIANMLIVKFEELLKNTSLIKESSDLAKKLQDRSMFKKDVKSIVGYFTPLLPFVGLIEGVVLTSSEIFDKFKTNKDSDAEGKNKNEGNSCESEERQKHDSTQRSDSEHDNGQNSSND